MQWKYLRLCVFYIGVSCASHTGYGAEAPELLVGIGIFRTHAISSVLPEYPASSLSAGHVGPAVIELRLSDEGTLRYSHVLEAPDSMIGSAVRDAVKRWSFRPFYVIEGGKTHPIAARSRLIFYFLLVDYRPLVIDAAAETNPKYLRDRPNDSHQ